MNVAGLVISVTCFPDAGRCILMLLSPSSGRWADTWCRLGARLGAGVLGAHQVKVTEQRPVVLPCEGPCAAQDVASPPQSQVSPPQSQVSPPQSRVSPPQSRVSPQHLAPGVGDAGRQCGITRDVSGEGGSAKVQCFPPAWELRHLHHHPQHPQQRQHMGTTRDSSGDTL